MILQYKQLTPYITMSYNKLTKMKNWQFLPNKVLFMQLPMKITIYNKTLRYPKEFINK